MSVSNGSITDLIPPVAARLYRRLRGTEMGFAGFYATWDDATSASNGYESDDILHEVHAAAIKVKRGEAAFERDGVAFEAPSYSFRLLSGLLWAAAMHGGAIRVMDYGGSLGSSFFQHRPFFDDLDDVKWGIVEQPAYVECGRAEFEDDSLRFFGSIAECVAAIAPDVVLLGSVLQYVEDPCRTLGELQASGADVLIVDRTPFSDLPRNEICVQRVPAQIYRASYPMWLFSRHVFRSWIDAAWEEVTALDSEEGTSFSVNGVTIDFAGMVLHERCQHAA